MWVVGVFFCFFLCQARFYTCGEQGDRERQATLRAWGVGVCWAADEERASERGPERHDCFLFSSLPKQSRRGSRKQPPHYRCDSCYTLLACGAWPEGRPRAHSAHAQQSRASCVFSSHLPTAPPLPPPTEPAMEATVIVVDNSEWTRNGDFPPTRFQVRERKRMGGAPRCVCAACGDRVPAPWGDVVRCCSNAVCWLRGWLWRRRGEGETRHPPPIDRAQPRPHPPSLSHPPHPPPRPKPTPSTCWPAPRRRPTPRTRSA